MEKKNIYIIIGIVIVVIAIPAVLLLLGFLGGFYFYMQGAR